MAVIAEAFRPGFFTQVEWNFDIPPDLGLTEPYFQLSMSLALSAAYTGVQSTLATFLYRTAAKNALPSVYTEVNKTFTSADPLAPLTTKTQRARFVIPNSALVGKEDGKLQIHFSVNSGSTGPIFLVGHVYHNYVFGPQPGGISNGFSFIT